MKNIIIGFLVLIAIGATNQALAQADSIEYAQEKIYVIITHDDIEFMGKILSKDEREVVILTLKDEKIAIPRYKVKEINEVKSGVLTSGGQYIPEEEFATRYILTTNGLGIKRGDNYVVWNLWGPDFQFGVSEHVSVGLMTTWIGAPIAANIKYSGEILNNFHGAGGVLLGSASWAEPRLWGILPYGALTLGDRRNNFTVSGGYGYVSYRESSGESALLSFGGMIKLAKKASFIFDSFIVPEIGDENTSVAILVPALRIQSESRKAFQIGFAGILTSQGSAPAPFPVLQWFRKF